MIKKVLVVGGVGYIGGCVTDILLKKRIPFAVYDNLMYVNHYLKPVEFIFGDIRDRQKLKGLFKDYSHVIWLAAIVGDGACNIKPGLTKIINQDCVNWLSKNFHGRIIFISTCSVYGKTDKPVDEASPTNPISLYAKTKLMAENYLKGKNALIFRLGTVFGVGDSYSRIRMDLVINYMTLNAIKNKRIVIFGGRQSRPFVHVKDTAQFIINNLDCPHTGIFNVATQNATILEVANIVQQETNCKVVIKRPQLEDERSYMALINKAVQSGVFSTKTKLNIRYGVREIKSLILSNRIKNLEYEFYSNQRALLNNLEQYEKILDNTYSTGYVKKTITI